MTARSPLGPTALHGHRSRPRNAARADGGACQRHAPAGGMMGKAIGGSLPIAIGITLSPMAITAVVLMLTSRKAEVNGRVFVLGWLIGLGIVGAI